jgi:DNA polymerase delta subunit 1
MELITRKKQPTVTSVQFQAREWESDDRNGKFHVYCFGVTEEGHSVCLDIEGFTPFFYLKVPDTFSSLNTLKETVQKGLRQNEKDLKSVRFFKKKSIDGFTNGKLFTFVRFVFKTQKSFKNAQYILAREHPSYQLYETKNNPLISMCHIKDILMAGWINATDTTPTIISRCQFNLSTSWKNISPIDRLDIPPFITLSYDIECYSYNYDFPIRSDGTIPEKNYITQIGNTIYNEKTEKYTKVIFVVGDCDPLPDTILKVCKTEAHLISDWVDFIRTTDPDQIIGYNIDDFDWKYIWQRAQLLGLEDKIGEISRLKHNPSKYRASHLESNAFGYNAFNLITSPGIGQIDLLHWFRKNKKLSSYSLDSVSELFLNENKRKVDIKDLFDWAGPKGDSKSRSIVADYCVQDTYLPIRLMKHFDILINLVEMSKITRVPITWLITRGESIKVYSQISYTARKDNYLIPAPQKYRAKQSFKGATVLSPKYGAYNEPVCGLDFASLYPSIMIAWNLCPTTFVKDKQYLNIPGVKYETFQWDGGNVTFVQNRSGLISGILKDLWDLRKVKKKLMATTDDKQMAKVYNGAQLAIKLSMNSVYGDLGSVNSPLSCPQISACVTFNGRNMIEWSKTCAHTWYNGSKNGYSDSLHSDEFVYVKDTKGNEKRMKIKNLGKQWTPFKQYTEINDEKDQGVSIYKIQTERGWSDITRVIKHKTKKKLLRITTEKGTLTVTEDHPLILDSGTRILAKDCTIGIELKTFLSYKI